MRLEVIVLQAGQEDADQEDGVAARAGVSARVVLRQDVRPGAAVVELLLRQGHRRDPPRSLQVERIVGGAVSGHDGLQRPARRTLVRAQSLEVRRHGPGDVLAQGQGALHHRRLAGQEPGVHHPVGPGVPVVGLVWES